MFKVTLSSDGDVFDLFEILEGLKVNMRQFQEMCIAAGCDYLKNINKVLAFTVHCICQCQGIYWRHWLKKEPTRPTRQISITLWQCFTIRQCSMWKHVVLFHFRNGTLTQPWMFRTSVDSILVMIVL